MGGVTAETLNCGDEVCTLVTCRDLATLTVTVWIWALPRIVFENTGVLADSAGADRIPKPRMCPSCDPT